VIAASVGYLLYYSALSLWLTRQFPRRAARAASAAASV